MAEPERRYTLAEAKLELHREECRQRGHDYGIVEAIGLEGPSAVVCERCGRQWPVVEAEPG